MRVKQGWTKKAVEKAFPQYTVSQSGWEGANDNLFTVQKDKVMRFSIEDEGALWIYDPTVNHPIAAHLKQNLASLDDSKNLSCFSTEVFPPEEIVKSPVMCDRVGNATYINGKGNVAYIMSGPFDEEKADQAPRKQKPIGRTRGMATGAAVVLRPCQ